MKTIPSIDKRLSHAYSLREQIVKSKIKLFQDNQFDIQCERFDNDLGIRLILKSFLVQTTLDDIGLLFGDCIHNLRSALDNLAYELACQKCNPPKKPRSISFPIMKNSSGFSSKAKICLEQLPKNAANLIESIQPFQRDGSPANGTPESDLLGLLHDIDLIDKHRIPSPVLLNPQEHNHSFSYDLTENEFALPEMIYFRQEPLEKDCILFEFKFPHRIHVHGEYNMSFILSFIINDRRFEVEELLNLLFFYTNQTINLFRDFFPNNPDIDNGNLVFIDVIKDENGFQFIPHDQTPGT